MYPLKSVWSDWTALQLGSNVNLYCPAVYADILFLVSVCPVISAKLLTAKNAPPFSWVTIKFAAGQNPVVVALDPPFVSVPFVKVILYRVALVADMVHPLVKSVLVSLSRKKFPTEYPLGLTIVVICVVELTYPVVVVPVVAGFGVVADMVACFGVMSDDIWLTVAPEPNKVPNGGMLLEMSRFRLSYTPVAFPLGVDTREAPARVIVLLTADVADT